MICGSHRESVASRASDMLIYNRPYIIFVATGDRAYVNLHPCSNLNSYYTWHRTICGDVLYYILRCRFRNLGIAINFPSWVSIQDVALLWFPEGAAIHAQKCNIRCNSMPARCDYAMFRKDVTIHTFSCNTCHHLGSVTCDRQLNQQFMVIYHYMKYFKLSNKNISYLKT